MVNEGDESVSIQFRKRNLREPVRMLAPSANRVFTPLRHKGVPSGAMLHVLKSGTLRLEAARARRFN
jgi:hypothetical protein